MADPKKIADVAHPNKSAPSGNSKSVIVTSRSRVQDPMVNVPDPEAETASSEKSKKLDIKPLTAPVLSTLHAPVETAEAIAESAVAEAAPATNPAPVVDPAPPKHVKLNLQPLPSNKTEAEKTETPAPEEPEEAAVQKKRAGKANAAEADQEALDAEKAKADAALQKLADSKQYFLPINTLEKRRSKRFVAFGIVLSLLMIIAWANIALDAGLITIDGVKPLTNFFST